MNERGGWLTSKLEYRDTSRFSIGKQQSECYSQTATNKTFYLAICCLGRLSTISNNFESGFIFRSMTHTNCYKTLSDLIKSYQRDSLRKFRLKFGQTSMILIPSSCVRDSRLELLNQNRFQFESQQSLQFCNPQ